MAELERYRIAELAAATGLTPRTIRFYVAEGLLPPPEGAGLAAVYHAGHRDRLRLIGQWKEQYLPLKEIRRRLATLTDAEVRALLVEETLAAPPATLAAASAGPGDALDYLDRVLNRGLRESAPPVPAAPPRRLPSPPPPAARERWERIVLAEGVELHVRDDRRAATVPLDALIRQARKLLGEE